MCINDYVVEYENGKAEVNGKCAARPQMVSGTLKITLADGTELTHIQEMGTPLKVVFKTQIKNGKITSVNSPEGATLNASTGEITYITTGTELDLEFEVTGVSGNDESTKKIKVSLDKYYGPVLKANSLLDAVEKNNFENDSTTNILVNNTLYSVHVYTHEGDLTISEDTEYGSANDVATDSEDAKNMVILKVNGNLTINNGATLTTVKSADGYGGPKGFLIYATGDITNNGTISMTARGAKAVGQDVYLWKNSDNSYEYIPALGAAGGLPATTINNGGNGSNRQLGGGGIGGHDGNRKSSGAAGTSYSGGTGGGGSGQNNGTKGTDGSDNGGAGGNGPYNDTGGGAGNPGGTGSWGAGGSNGTGGLLILYATSINNAGIIVSNGSAGGNSACHGAGGGSGAGSINVFYKNNIVQGTINVIGGAGGKEIGWNAPAYAGGSGGTGSIAIGKIANGTYTDTYHNWTD